MVFLADLLLFITVSVCYPVVTHAEIILLTCSFSLCSKWPVTGQLSPLLQLQFIANQGLAQIRDSVNITISN